MDKLELAPDFIQGIDWEKFKTQRETLNNVIHFSGDIELVLAMTYSKDIKITKDLEGIHSLLDAICDYAVDFCELPEDEVYNIQNDEK